MFDFLSHIDSPKIKEIKQNFENKEKQILFGVHGIGNQSFLLGMLGAKGALIAKDLVSASKIAENLMAYGFNVKFITSPFENALGLVDQNLKDDFFASVCDYLTNSSVFLIILTNALIQKVPTKQSILENTLMFQEGKEYAFQNLSKMLVKIGYEKTENVFARGQFAIKGDTLFLWSIIRELLKKPVVTDAVAVEKLCKRGFGAHFGVCRDAGILVRRGFRPAGKQVICPDPCVFFQV